MIDIQSSYVEFSNFVITLVSSFCCISQNLTSTKSLEELQ